MNISTSTFGNIYYQEETINFENTITLAYLSIIISVQKTLTINNPHSYETVGGGILSTTIDDTYTRIVYTFNINNGNILWPGQWSVTAQFDLNNQVRDTSNDLYSIQTDSSQIITGHF
jgi:hypothetical protein